MRRRTRIAVVLLVAVVVALLALGALPSALATGDPYYLTAEQVNESAVLAGTNATDQAGTATTTATTETGSADRPANATARAVNVTGLSERRFPYASEAFATGRSEGYRTGPFGLKEPFAHSPFDELSALRGRTPTAAGADDVVFAVDNGTFYRLAIRQ
jgi:hypothetical protein